MICKIIVTLFMYDFFEQCKDAFSEIYKNEIRNI